MSKLSRATIAAIALVCSTPAIAKPAPAAKPLPGNVDDADYERLGAATAEARAADSQLTAAKLAVRVAEYEAAAAHAKADALFQSARKKYSLTDRDTVDPVEPHKITRAK